MIIIRDKKILFFLFIAILFFSCNSQKNILKDNCEKNLVSTDTVYTGFIKENKLIFDDFNSTDNKNELDIVSIKIKTGYDYEESVNRFYIQDGSYYILRDGIVKSQSEQEKNHFLEKVSNYEFEDIYVSCERYSSLKIIYKVFIKKNGKLLSTFYMNNDIENIDESIIKNQIGLLRFIDN